MHPPCRPRQAFVTYSTPPRVRCMSALLWSPQIHDCSQAQIAGNIWGHAPIFSGDSEEFDSQKKDPDGSSQNSDHRRTLIFDYHRFVLARSGLENITSIGVGLDEGLSTFLPPKHTDAGANTTKASVRENVRRSPGVFPQCVDRADPTWSARRQHHLLGGLVSEVIF